MAITIRVGVPPDQVALASLSDLKSDLNILDDTQDPDLTRRLLEASSSVLSYIGRPILSCDWRDTIDLRQGQASVSLMLGRYPVTKIKAVSINGTDMSSDDLTNVFGWPTGPPCVAAQLPLLRQKQMACCWRHSGRFSPRSASACMCP